MSKGAKFLIFIGLCLAIVGTVLFVLYITKNSSTNNLITNEHEITEEFTNFNFDIDTAHITFVASTDGKTKVVCEEKEKQYHEVKVVDNTLMINSIDESKFYDNIFNFGIMKITIYLPNNVYNDLLIKSATGDINITSNLKFHSVKINASTADIKMNGEVEEELNISVSTGKTNLENLKANSIQLTSSTGGAMLKNVNVTGDIKVTTDTGKTTYEAVRCNNLEHKSSTGKIYFIDFIASGALKVKASTGDISFDRSDAASINIKTSTGDVTGNLLTPKTFYVKTSTGKNDTPKTNGDPCDIETSTGDVEITIAE